MDYCSSCRRHLNGALVCPGCGAYAPDIAPVTEHSRTFAPFAAKSPPRPEPHPYDPFEETSHAEAAVPSGEGRAARRRQRARWKKNQRKAVLATTVALVGGGLALSTMDDGSGHRAEASTTPDLAATGTQDLPAQQYGEPTATAPGTGKHRKPESTSDRTTSSGDAQRHSATTPDAPRTTSARTQPYTPQHTTPTTQSRTATAPSSGTASGNTGSTTPSQSPSATTGGDSSASGSSGSDSAQTGSSQEGSSGSGSSGSNSSGSSSSPSGDTATTSPSGICVLGLLCVS